MAVVEVKNAYKYYGRKSNPTIILNNLNMTVQPGTIYGLLGASGCGKTTLLSCIVGLRQLNNGSIQVLGQKPGDQNVVSRIGYMPQELALVPEMTVKQIIFYFGRIYGMTIEKMHEKYDVLKKLLELPPSRQLVKNCSGGQQRRISFACALIHDPQLLILDEPTVGMDPILRDKIWDFLVDTIRQSNTAVIITTHYIDEARQANCVGLMRHGILLTQDSPTNIILRFDVDSLEDAFLMLCRTQGNAIDISGQNGFTNQMTEQIVQSMEISNKHLDTKEQLYNNENWERKGTSSKDILKALLTKNFIKMKRNILMLCFILILPLICELCFVTSIGKTLKGLKLGLVNMESTCEYPNMTLVYGQDNTCYMANISCKLIRSYGSTDYIKPIVYHNLKDAHRDAKSAIIMGYIHIPKNFSKAMQARLEDGIYIDNQTLDQTMLETHLDMGAGQSSYYTELKIVEHFQNFVADILSDCEIPKHLAALPISFQDPIYGSEEADTQQFMAPGLVLTLVFFLNTLVMANIFIEERSDGVWDRTVIAGATANQFLWSHMIIQFLLSIIQNIEFLLFIFWIFESNYKGSKMAFTVLLFLLSTSGMFFGLLLSIYCKTHTNSNYIVTGTFYVMITMCGLVWPLEGMPNFMKKIVEFTPFALPSVSARNIIVKGWELTHNGVYMGYLVITAWIFIFYTLCIIGIKIKF